MPAAALQRSRQIAKTVTDNLGGQGLNGVELFVKGEQVWFSEVSPRPHDIWLVTLTTQVQSEFELHARAILGLPVKAALRVPNTDLRLFGKPESFMKRRMDVVLAFDANVEVARQNAKLAASKVKPRVA